MDRTGTVHHRGAQVTEHGVRIPHPVPGPVQAEERLLHDILRGGLVAHQHERETDQAGGVPPEQVIDSFPRVMTTRTGLWRRASPVCGDRHADKTPGRQGMLSPVTKSGQAAGPARSPWPQLLNLKKLAERHQDQAG